MKKNNKQKTEKFVAAHEDHHQKISFISNRFIE